MRILPTIPAAITLLATALISAVHPVHAGQMMLACEITGGITIVAASTIVAIQKSSAMTVTQVALAATVGQMMLTGLSAMVVWAMQWVPDFQAFALWLLVFYWLELLVLTFIAVRVIRGSSAMAREPAVKCL